MVSRWSEFGESVEHWQVGRWLVVGGRWVSEALVGGPVLVVSGRFVGGALVGGSIAGCWLSVGRLLVDCCWWLVSGQ